MKTATRILLVLVSLCLAACAESAGSGRSTTIPIVNLSCATSRCRGVASAKAYIVYTTSSCANASFGATVAGSTTLTCNATGCLGSVLAFTDPAGLSTNSMREGFYSICVIGDFNSNYAGSAVAGEDTTGALTNATVSSSVRSLSVTSFSDI